VQFSFEPPEYEILCQLTPYGHLAADLLAPDVPEMSNGI
jgi:hypothetical protein